MHVPWVHEIHLVVVPAVARMREDVAASGCDCFQGVRAKDPVAEIDDMDVLFNENVTREGPIPKPIPQSNFVG